MGSLSPAWQRQAPQSTAGPAADPPPPVGLAGEVGAEVASSLAQALARLDAILGSGKVGRPGLDALRGEIERARQAAMLGQQISRLAAGRVQQSPAALDLPTMLRGAIAGRRATLVARGLTLQQRLRPASVTADPGLCAALLEAALDWAIEHGDAPVPVLRLTTELNTWPVFALLTIALRRQAGADDGAEAQLDNLAWRLVEQASAAMGVRLARQVTAGGVELTLAFPEVARRWPTLEAATPATSALAVDDNVSRPLAGVPVLLLSTRVELLGSVRAAVEPLGAGLVVARSVEAARDAHARHLARVLVLDHLAPGGEALARELHAGGSGPALVVVDELPPGVHVVTTGRSEIWHVGRDTVPRDLPAALRHALAAR